MTSTVLVAGVLVLAAGTYALRYAGTMLRARTVLPALHQRLAGVAVAVIFVSLATTSAVVEGTEFAGPARPVGVAVATVLAFARAPFIVVVLGAAVTTAMLRAAGVP